MQKFTSIPKITTASQKTVSDNALSLLKLTNVTTTKLSPNGQTLNAHSLPHSGSFIGSLQTCQTRSANGRSISRIMSDHRPNEPIKQEKQMLTLQVDQKPIQMLLSSNSESSKSSFQDLENTIESIHDIMYENVNKLYGRTENLDHLEAKAKQLTEQVSELSFTTNRVAHKIINAKVKQMRLYILLFIALVVCLCLALSSGVYLVYNSTEAKMPIIGFSKR
jgi:hypothetical protein